MTSLDAITSVVAEQLATLRRERGWSLDDLAARADLHRTSLGLIERGKRGMTLGTAYRLATALEVSLADVLRRAEEELGRQ